MYARTHSIHSTLFIYSQSYGSLLLLSLSVIHTSPKQTKQQKKLKKQPKNNIKKKSVLQDETVLHQYVQLLPRNSYDMLCDIQRARFTLSSSILASNNASQPHEVLSPSVSRPSRPVARSDAQ